MPQSDHSKAAKLAEAVGNVPRQSKNKKGDVFRHLPFLNPGRGERIRTSDSYVPNVVLYQAELHPEIPDSALSITLNREGQQF